MFGYIYNKEYDFMKPFKNNQHVINENNDCFGESMHLLKTTIKPRNWFEFTCIGYIVVFLIVRILSII